MLQPCVRADEAQEVTPHALVDFIPRPAPPSAKLIYRYSSLPNFANVNTIRNLFTVSDRKNAPGSEMPNNPYI